MNTATKHSPTCNMAFGRKDATCPRCQELTAGAPARQGWGALAKRNERTRITAIRAHVCSVATCGPVCTAFDW